MAPTFTRRPEDTVAAEGSTVQLICQASGHPRPTFSWTKDMEQLGLDPRLTDDGDGILTIRNIQDSDRAVYQCYASNAVQTISASANLFVRSKSEWNASVDVFGVFI
mgnify:CR=1 FL=1